MIDKIDILNKIRQVIKSVAPECCKDFSKIIETTDFIFDLGFDSMDYIMLCGLVEETFNVKVNNETTYIVFKNVGDLLNYIVEQKENETTL